LGLRGLKFISGVSKPLTIIGSINKAYSRRQL
jgi:hypothetical protein